MKESELKARYNYRSKGKRMSLDFYPSEQDVIDHIGKQEHPTTYIKNLVRKDMKVEKNI